MVYIHQVNHLEKVRQHRKNGLAIEVSPGRAYIKGYRTEFLTPQYVDLPKPRDFEAIQNTIIPLEWGQYVKVFDVYGWPNFTGEGVQDAYQIVDLYDGWGLNTGASISGQKIGRARCVQLQKSGAGIFDMYMMDIQMYTGINFVAGNTTVSTGDKLVGRISGATGFVTSDFSGTRVSLEQVSGNFVDGEVITRDGRVVGTLDAVHTYKVIDARSAVGYNASSIVSFLANFLLNDRQAIRGASITVDLNGSPPKITGTNGSKFEQDLRPGDVLCPDGLSSPEGEKTFVITKAVKNAINLTSQNNTGVTPYVFDYQAQTATVDTSLTKGSITDGTYTTVVRYRPYLYGQNIPSGQLSQDMPKKTIKSISDESFFVFRTFDNKTVVSGGLTVALPESEQFAALDDDNYILTILAEGGSAYSVGQNLDIEALSDSGALSVTYGADRQSITIGGLTNVTTVKLTALVSKNIVSRKIKTASKMRAMKITRTAKQQDVQRFGLLYGGLYGTRIEDTEISFGLNDVYKLHAVYESSDDNPPKIPYICSQRQLSLLAQLSQEAQVEQEQ